MPIIGALMGFLLLSGSLSMPAQADAPGLPPLPTYTVAMTGYNAVPEQTDSDPFVTASGAFSNPEIIAARSRDLKEELPFGTIIEISGPTATSTTCGYKAVAPVVGYRIIADTMNARYTDRVDLLFSLNDNYITSGGKTKNASHVLGICRGMTIRVVGQLDPTKVGKFPKTQKALAALVEGGSAIAVR